MTESIKKSRESELKTNDKNKPVKPVKGDVDDFIFKNEEVKKCSER